MRADSRPHRLKAELRTGDSEHNPRDEPPGSDPELRPPRGHSLETLQRCQCAVPVRSSAFTRSGARADPRPNRLKAELPTGNSERDPRDDPPGSDPELRPPRGHSLETLQRCQCAVPVRSSAFTRSGVRADSRPHRLKAELRTEDSEHDPRGEPPGSVPGPERRAAAPWPLA